jgi:hypothetical protein
MSAPEGVVASGGSWALRSTRRDVGRLAPLVRAGVAALFIGSEVAVDHGRHYPTTTRGRVVCVARGTGGDRTHVLVVDEGDAGETLAISLATVTSIRELVPAGATR